MPVITASQLLKFPPAIRTLVATRYGISPGLPFLQLTSPRWEGTFSDPNHDGQISVIRQRSYATIHADDTERLWSQHGLNAPVWPAAGDTLQERLQAHSSQAPFAGDAGAEQRDSAESTERQRLIDLCHKRARKKKSTKRRQFRQHINDALQTTDPISALKRLAFPHLRSKSARDDTDVNDLFNSNSNALSEINEIQLLNVEQIQRTKTLPTREQYPDALDELFQPKAVSQAVHNACSTLKLSMQTEVDYAEKQDLSKEARKRLSPSSKPIHVCTLSVDIPNIYEDTANGEGLSRVAAKQAAWLHLVSKMHVDGKLREIFPDPTVEDDNVEPALQPVEVDELTKSEEKDAKLEIYNYAAGLGLVPHFEMKAVQPRMPRARRGRILKKPKSVFQVTIVLEGRNIKVTAAGKDLQTAEVAAALAFKEQAEKLELSQDGLNFLHRKVVLSVDTAQEFFEFYKNRTRGINVEIERETVQQDKANNQNRARVTINGNPTGEAATMKTKKEADSVAYLTAAVEITNNDPELLREFSQALRRGSGKILRPLNSINFEVDFETLYGMRSALVEARNAGLSDFRQPLDAETPKLDERNMRRQKRLSPAELVTANDRLSEKHARFEEDSRLEVLRSKIATLPMSQYRNQVLNMISGNPYSIIVGATGSGKTTQVPQILFDNAIKNGYGASCNIICTQPRRLAATSVAQRVAVERDEPLRKTVGYQVRFDSKPPYEPYGITYCTTGVLLERLKHNPDEVLDTVSHVVIDEVHERDLLIDFVMIVLKRAIRIRQAQGKTVPKVVLMSATLDTELFAKYFGSPDSEGGTRLCPSLIVPGRTYPVEEKYLGSIVDEMLEKHGSGVKKLLDLDPKTELYLKCEDAFAVSHRNGTASSVTESVIDWKRDRQQSFEIEETVSAAGEKEEAIVPISLAAATVAHICKTSGDGAILAFLPGLDEIMAVQKILLEQRPFGLDFSDTSRFQMCPLHSTTSKEQQMEVFNPSLPSCRKIILSTNIAETSVTVTEVKYIVDSGKLREKRYDQLRRITKLQCVWESKSNAKQRAGRAGRVQDGFYYALFSNERSESFRAIGLPELLRSDLQEVCLSVKSQNFDEPVEAFLAQAIEPPSSKAVGAALRNLVDIEAFTKNESMTALGRVLSRLPVHPSLGKMIILGVIFRCLDPMIILGAATNERSLFWTPVGMRAEATRSHRSYAGNEQSDQIAFLEAFKELRVLDHQYGFQTVYRRARENFLHAGAYRIIDQTAKQIADVLTDSGLISTPLDGFGQDRPEYGPPDLNRNAHNSALVKCLLLAGLHPNLAVKRTSEGVVYRTSREHGVIMHPASLNAEMKKADKHPYGTMFTYGTLAKSNDGHSLFLRESSRVTPLMAVLFGGQLRMTDAARLEMDEWLPFFVKATDRQFAAKLILEFRKALDRVLHSAFGSLQDLSPSSAGQFVNDPMREQFAKRVVQILSPKQSPLGAAGAWQNAWQRFSRS